jgi:superfamily II DNA or RNA helicase
VIVSCRGRRSLLVTAPTGSDKTIIASALVASVVAAGQPILVLPHRREMIDQTISKLRDNRRGEEVAYS